MSQKMKVLIACEESQEVCKAFRELGHEAYSCDIEMCSGGRPEWHIMQDVIPLLNGNCFFHTRDMEEHYISGKWDLIIAHPPCTDLAVSGARWFKQKQKDGSQKKSIDFFMQFTKCDCERVAIENPVCIMSSIWRKPDQIIQPYQFGHRARKKTCLWLKGLPKLQYTKIVDCGEIVGKGFSAGANSNHAVDENGKIIPWNDPRTAKARSKTFSGIAKAMAEQWGGLVEDKLLPEPPETDKTEYQTPKKTNADKIRSLTDEELDMFLRGVKNRARLIALGNKPELMRRLVSLDWLKEECKD